MTRIATDEMVEAACEAFLEQAWKNNPSVHEAGRRCMKRALTAALALLPEPVPREPTEAWSSIDSAPRDGTHILACGSGFYTEHWTFNQAPPQVVHYWSNPGEKGFYNSKCGDADPEPVTRWKPLPDYPSSTDAAQEQGK